MFCLSFIGLPILPHGQGSLAEAVTVTFTQPSAETRRLSKPLSGGVRRVRRRLGVRVESANAVRRVGGLLLIIILVLTVAPQPDEGLHALAVPSPSFFSLSDHRVATLVAEPYF